MKRTRVEGGFTDDEAEAEDAAAASRAAAEKDELYDRQLRLWGVQVQQRIGCAKILVCGLSGISSEVCKNLILSGVEAVTIVDDKLVEEADLASNFFLTAEDIGSNRAQAALSRLRCLNPHVRVQALTANPLKPSDADVESNDLICASSCSLEALVQINDQARKLQRPFFGFGSFGKAAFTFVDLLDHQYSETPLPQNDSQSVTVHKVMDSVPLSKSLSSDLACFPRRPHRLLYFLRVWHAYESRRTVDDAVNHELLEECHTAALSSVPEKSIKKSRFSTEFTSELCAMAGSESSPIASIVGGQTAQQVIRVISKKDQPMMNWLCYDSLLGGCSIQNVGCCIKEAANTE